MTGEEGESRAGPDSHLAAKHRMLTEGKQSSFPVLERRRGDELGLGLWQEEFEALSAAGKGRQQRWKAWLSRDRFWSFDTQPLPHH